MRILYVEDDSVLANLVKTFLSRDEVLVTGKLSEAISYLNHESFDFLIADLHLEDSDANTTLTLLDDFDVPKIIVTVDDDERLMETALLMDHPPEDYILKGDHPGIHLIRKIKFNVDKVRNEHEKSRGGMLSYFDSETLAHIKHSLTESLQHKQLIM